MKSNIFYLFIFICLTRVVGFTLLPFLLKTSPILGIMVSIFQCTIGYEFGKKHGVIGIEWMERHRLVSESGVRRMNQWLRFSATLILFLIPGPLVAMVAGVSQLGTKNFYAIMIPSQILWILACYYLGVELEVYLKIVKTFVIDHGIAITSGLIIAHAVYHFLNRGKLQ
jgi:membrane protein DedA with SNARE-associated domain